MEIQPGGIDLSKRRKGDNDDARPHVITPSERRDGAEFADTLASDALAFLERLKLPAQQSPTEKKE